ncbi:serine/threonine-protein kinase [uncultured Methanospirillum sp.]|uniref:serine/threonine-protein kinase n=1 Tax=uncultured Methanospirillum sp. TaxID=262503 RepID=UPI0029C7A8E7|nr:serine/threonine-protein kinase [uncultured Methanospirillum sp.]
MKTTIFPADPELLRRSGVKSLTPHVLNLLLAGSYLVLILLLASSPAHRYGGMGGPMSGGVNAGMGGSTVSLPLVYLLFSLLIIVHLASLYRSRLPWHLFMAVGLGMIISSTLTLGLFFFVRQYSNLLQSVYPVPSLVSISLILSFLLGVYGVTELVRKRHSMEENEKDGSRSTFPLSQERYRNIRLLTEGGVGTIWYAERISDDLPVVVKVPRRDDEQTGMSFMQEISVWKDLEHPHIAQVLSANILPVPYIEIEYLPGTLADLEKPLPVPQALQIITSLVSALIYAHDRGVAHCDIKPSNILLTQDNVPRLTDWGLARSGSSRWSVSGFSPRYAAPEQNLPNPGCGYGTDIWQIGMVFTDLLTGRAEFPSETEPVFLQREGADILPVLQRCLASDPHDRYRSAKALMEDLNAILSRS